MLIITRKEGQGFTIGKDIFIKITLIDGGKLRVGIDAPKDVKILREELVETEGTGFSRDEYQDSRGEISDILCGEKNIK